MKKIILITGVSSGFGKESARLLAEAGHTVYGTVRRDCETDKSINILRMDLTDAVSIHEAVEAVISKEGRIDVLINNAGMHSAGPVETIPGRFIRLQMDTNFLGLVHLTKEVLPYMRKQGGGMIINFSSIGGLMGFLSIHSIRLQICNRGIHRISQNGGRSVQHQSCPDQSGRFQYKQYQCIAGNSSPQQVRKIHTINSS